MGAVSYTLADKVVFLDRDGVINQRPAPHEYICSWRDFRFLPDVPEAIRMLNGAGYRVVVVTNQRGVARGHFTMETLEALHARMCQELESHNAFIDNIYVCPHDNGSCECRKPKTGLFLRAEKDYDVNKALSWMIGDSQSDVLAGKSYGVKTILIGREELGQDMSCESLLDAALFITGGSI